MARHFALISLILSISLLGVSCRKGEQQTAEAPAKDSSPTEQPSTPAKIEIPAADLTQALKLLGAPFEKPLKYRVSGLPIAQTEVTQTFRVTSVDAGKVVISAPWDAREFGEEEYESQADGVYCTKLQGLKLDSPMLYLPAELPPNKTWTQQCELKQGDEVLRIVNNCKVVGRQKVTVPLGEFDSLLVETTGTIKSASVNIKTTAKSWFVEGVGLVKTTGTQTGKRQGTDINTTVEIVAVK